MNARSERIADLVGLASDAFARHKIVERREDRWRLARVEDGRIQSPYHTEIVSLWGERLFVGGDVDDCVFAYAGTSDHVAKVRWLAQSSLDYACEKAKIGLTDSGKLTTEGRSRNKSPSPRVVYAWVAIRRLWQLLDQGWNMPRRIEPGFVGAGSVCAWHPWPDSREVKVEVPVESSMVWLVEKKNLGKIAGVETFGPQLWINGRAYALDDALARGLARIVK